MKAQLILHVHVCILETHLMKDQLGLKHCVFLQDIIRILVYHKQ